MTHPDHPTPGDATSAGHGNVDSIAGCFFHPGRIPLPFVFAMPAPEPTGRQARDEFGPLALDYSGMIPLTDDPFAAVVAHVPHWLCHVDTTTAHIRTADGTPVIANIPLQDTPEWKHHAARLGHTVLWYAAVPTPLDPRHDDIVRVMEGLMRRGDLQGGMIRVALS